ncbi:unnamed protein product [Rotaria magnacalcarata]|uniref:RAI1-like domain-containing protein n=1 Tax=Rotaria magnacalcarata TaxID=392030 RepID=A0A8S2JWY2_9BILA|nr:unnamed protein product [Rotaria magnacalcarata]
MDLSSHERERKLVPRFRRKNHNKNLVDLDDQEAQALIEKDLESHFKWTSDIADDFKYQYDDYQYEENDQQISINDQTNDNFLYDIENSSEQLWKNNMENDDNQFTKWTHDQKQNKISFSIETIQHKQQQWGLDDNNQRSIQFNLINPNEQQYKHDLDTNNDISQKRFIGGDEFRNKLSVDDENYKQLFSLIDFSFKQTLSISSNDIKDQLLTIIDSFEIEHNFGHDDQEQFYQWSLKDLKIIILNLSPIEILNLIYSPIDVKQILLENLLIDSDEISARAFRRYRCKHMSIKNDDKDQLDSLEGLKLQFKGNEQIAIGEKHIENDFNEEQIYQDITNCKILLESEHPQSYDVKIDENSSMNQGPCLYRSDYECQPPKTWSRLRREIGYISFDGSLSQPIYYLNKSFKRFVNVPINRDHCSSNVYNGYSQFIEKIRLNPDNYFRAFDSIDLRPLLHWYSQKQNLFSSTNKKLLKPPTFICRRLVLRTILANLYCDSDPWKLLVVRIKGQFYLALANRQTKSAEDITIDEYSGYKFEALFTSDQPNTTRLTEKVPLEKPQQQFHTVQYWQFGDFNLLYSNEIDGEIVNDIQEKPTTTETTQNLKPENEATTTTTTVTKETSAKSGEVDWWEEGIPTDIESSSDQIQDKLKEMQINENLQLTNDENETVEKKKRNENQIKAGYVEMKCTNKKIFYRDENKLQTLYWWAQMWLANVNTLMIGYKTSNDGTVNQLDFLSTDKLISKFLSKYDLRLKYCFSYLYSFLNLIEKTITIDDPNTIHAFAYIPQPLEIDPLTGKPLQYDLPKCVPFRYTQIKRSNQRHSNFMPQWYLENIQRTSPIGGILQDDQLKTVEEEMKKRIGHRGRASCILKQEKFKKRHK